MLFCMVLFGRTLGAGALHANSQYYRAVLAGSCRYTVSDSYRELSVIPVLVSSCENCV